MPAGGFGYPMAWSVPQWFPHTSMAMFAPVGYHPLQFAGQQGPADATPQQPQFSRVRLAMCRAGPIVDVQASHAQHLLLTLCLLHLLLVALPTLSYWMASTARLLEF